MVDPFLLPSNWQWIAMLMILTVVLADLSPPACASDIKQMIMPNVIVANVTKKFILMLEVSFWFGVFV